jgi:DNA repair exonuclease SbcCD ATPase subunit
MSSNIGRDRDILRPPRDAKPGFQFSLKSTNKEDSAPFLQSASGSIEVSMSPSLPISRQPLQHLRMNPNNVRRAEPQWGHHNVQRSQTLKGASNLPKETRLLQKKLDFMLQGFQETVVEHDRSQQIRLRQLQVENDKLRKANNELEIENLTYFKELEDCEEHIDELEQQRKNLIEKLSKFRQDVTYVETLKNANEVLQKKNEAMLKELNEYADSLHQKDSQVREMQIELEKLKNNLHANDNTSSGTGTNLEK